MHNPLFFYKHDPHNTPLLPTGKTTQQNHSHLMQKLKLSEAKLMSVVNILKLA